MIQPAPPDTTEFRALLERWGELPAAALLTNVVFFVVLAVLLYLAMSAARKVTGRHIEDVNKRHRIRKWVGYAYVILLLLLGVGLFADALLPLGAFLAILLAALAVALQDILKSVVGWFYLNTRSGVQVGSRLEIDGVKGDVIDIALLKTTLLEVGGDLVHGLQSTGRLVTVPNWRILAANAYISAADNLFVWQELQMVVTYESDWRRAEEVLSEVAYEIHSELAPELAAAHQRMERRYAYKHGFDTPIVYVRVADHGVELTLRYLTHVRRRRGTVDRISRHFMEAVETEAAVELAYPTWRIYKRGEEEGSRGEGG